MIRLTKQQVISIHNSLISATGGSYGVRDDDLLESALNVPFQTFDGQNLYPTLLQKSARLGFSLVLNHPFVDGNKRIGIHAMLTFLTLNGVELIYSQEELIELGLKIAAGQITVEKLLDWIVAHNE